MPRRGTTLIVIAVAAAGFAALAGWAHVDDPASLAGPARVIDGDSLRIGGRDVRLHGIDAPELSQTCEKDGRAIECGRAARAELSRLIGGRDALCHVRGRDRYGRALAACEVGGTMLNAAMVEGGHAVAFGAFGREEAAAKAGKLGLWATKFDPPREWRAKHGRPQK